MGLLPPVHTGKLLCCVQWLLTCDRCIPSPLGCWLCLWWPRAGIELSWKGPLQVIYYNPCAVYRDAHSPIRYSEPIQSDFGWLQGYPPTASLGSLCQGFTNFILKNFLLTPSLNLSFFLSLEPFILVLSQKTQLESNPLLSHSPSLGTGGFLEGSGHTLSLQHLGWDRSP